MDYIYMIFDWLKAQLLNPVIMDIPTAVFYLLKCLGALFLSTLIFSFVLNLIIPKATLTREARASVCFGGGVIGSMLMLLGTLCYLYANGKFRTYWDLGCFAVLFFGLFIAHLMTIRPLKHYEKTLAELRA